jgi:hypothetical protein
MSQLQRIAIAPSQFQQEQILLTPQQQHYLGRVLRLCDGDRFIAMDGKGKWWLAQLEGEKAQVLEPLTVQTELPVSITLMVALPKGNGFDDVVRCCTELGVAVIAPVVSDRTLLNPSPQKLERWYRVAQVVGWLSRAQPNKTKVGVGLRYSTQPTMIDWSISVGIHYTLNSGSRGGRGMVSPHKPRNFRVGDCAERSAGGNR